MLVLKLAKPLDILAQSAPILCVDVRPILLQNPIGTAAYHMFHNMKALLDYATIACKP